MQPATDRALRLGVRVLAGTFTFLLVLAAGAAGVAALLRQLEDVAGEPVRCAAVDGETSWFLETDQAETAALIAARARQLDLPARAVTIGLATGLQESKLRNIDYGDRDSVGIFQQRPSQGWGTVEQIMDPVYSTDAFYEGLSRVDGYIEMDVTVAAQAVQRSGFPDAYAKHEARSRAWASGLTGYSAASITCTLDDPGAGSVDAYVARVHRDYAPAGEQVPGVSAAGDAAVVLDAPAVLGEDEEPLRAGWSLAQWSVAVADALEVVEVRHADQVWTRDEGAWAPAEEPTDDGQVTVLVSTG
ncbi:hypothetical protein [Cellulomonas bogoriensis]|uniref:Cobalt transporter n=1 Tax=Cellulomonas bogoriensis 69B4 = DSM 16987 TaxID=1386082 RepID=A0A0A0BPN5_9CELL|nr:hypothetical protein [Cellulomonas bogoriensis]KGM09622.1 hypothetical protein N869_03735 [Cellulomonas bogoriensis 69B4 = DSM 16987]